MPTLLSEQEAMREDLDRLMIEVDRLKEEVLALRYCCQQLLNAVRTLHEDKGW